MPVEVNKRYSDYRQAIRQAEEAPPKVIACPHVIQVKELPKPAPAPVVCNVPHEKHETRIHQLEHLVQAQ